MRRPPTICKSGTIGENWKDVARRGDGRHRYVGLSACRRPDRPGRSAVRWSTPQAQGSLGGTSDLRYVSLAAKPQKYVMKRRCTLTLSFSLYEVMSAAASKSRLWVGVARYTGSWYAYP